MRTADHESTYRLSRDFYEGIGRLLKLTNLCKTMEEDYVNFGYDILNYFSFIH
jgi:hypothetical protein